MPKKRAYRDQSARRKALPLRSRDVRLVARIARRPCLPKIAAPSAETVVKGKTDIDPFIVLEVVHNMVECVGDLLPARLFVLVNSGRPVTLLLPLLGFLLNLLRRPATRGTQYLLGFGNKLLQQTDRDQRNVGQWDIERRFVGSTVWRLCVWVNAESYELLSLGKDLDLSSGIVVFKVVAEDQIRRR
jgi:hypothetical protein